MSETTVPITITGGSYNEYINWIEEAIDKKHIRYYEYENFNNIEEIGSGKFGIVYRATWENPHNYLALKSFFNLNNITIKEIVNELKLQREVDFHENIIHFFGLTRENQNDNSKKYWLVMEYANNGTLQEYLEKYFNTLTWNDKFNMALQLAHAVLCLHDEGIIHRDLHSRNVLVNQNTIKLADLGLSKRIDEANNSRLEFGVLVPYIDPKKFGFRPYSLSKKSDIYSIGVLLWEISSGQPPFKDLSSYDLIVQISQGLRETPVPGTPNTYLDLYTECWNGEPDNRPNINQIVAKLKELKYNLTNDDFRVMVDEIVDLSSKIKDDDEEIQKILSYLDNKNVTSQEFYNWILNDQDNTNSIVLLGDFNYLGIGINSNKRKAFELYQKAANLGNIFGIISLGYCYQYGIGTIIDEIKVLESYQKVADLGNLYGVNSLGYCYEVGIGTNMDTKKAFELYESTANLGDTTGINNLGYCYQNGIGTNIDKRKAFELYQQAANLGDSEAQYNLASMYENGEGIAKDIYQAIYWYKKSAKQGIKIAQDQLNKLLASEDIQLFYS
ncbi:kinase-like protein [Rhizophagus irregularis]|uniref:Kinase-like protein n=1 Tax=Rhizophagus irregularis TaxID=588596 RepID=A0A2N1N4G6_9GLOM|nr:kinase-like protein [Rhizophagus irregularis]